MRDGLDGVGEEKDLDPNEDLSLPRRKETCSDHMTADNTQTIQAGLIRSEEKMVIEEITGMGEKKENKTVLDAKKVSNSCMGIQDQAY